MARRCFTRTRVRSVGARLHVASVLLERIRMRLLSVCLVLVLSTATTLAAPRTTISTDPIGLLRGTTSLSLTRSVHRHIAIRGNGAIREMIGFPDAWYELGLGAQLFLDASGDGPFVEGGLVARSIPISFDATGVDHLRLFGPAAYVGWQRTFSSGLMLAIAIGTTKTWSNSAPPGASIVGPAITTIGAIGAIGGLPESYLRVGYAF